MKRRRADEAASAAGPLSESAPVSAPPPPPPQLSLAQLLFDSGLHCISAFLSLREALAGYHSCRSWYLAAQSEPCRELRLSEAFVQSTSSPLRFHVVAVAVDASEMELSVIRGVVNRPWPSVRALTVWPLVDGLRAVVALPDHDKNILRQAIREEMASGSQTFAAQALAKLEDPLAAAIMGPEEHHRHALVAEHMRCGASCFPPCLTSLDILMDADRFSRDMQQWRLETLQYNHNLTRLSIALPPPHDPPLDVTMLRSLTQLKQLYLAHIDLSDANLRAIKQMASLQLLSASGMCWAPKELGVLCGPPHSLRNLHTLVTRFPQLTPAHCNELRNLPALSSLAFASLDSEAAPMLAQFPCLRILDFCSGTLAPSAAVAALTATRGLTELTQHSVLACTYEEHVQLLEALASLKKLTLKLASLTDLTCLQPYKPLQPAASCSSSSSSSSSATATLTRTPAFPLLETLVLRGCTFLPTSQLHHVCALPSLLHLSVIDSFTHPLDGFARQALRPPSRMLPRLQSFTCEDQRPMLD